jgi:O-antigen/teichoic acid export membrane protein
MALGIARNIVLVPLYLQHMSAAEYGAWLATGGTLVQLLVTDFGVGGVILQRTATASGAGDREQLSVIVGTAAVTSVVIAVIVSAASAGISPLLPSLLRLDTSWGDQVIHCFLLSIVANAIAVIATIAASVLRGLQRAGSAGVIQFLSEVTVITVTVLMLYRGFGLYALAWGMVARSAFAALASVIQAYRVCVRELRLTPHLQAAESRRLMTNSTRLFVVSLSMKLLTRSDVFFVGAVLGSPSAAVYGVTTRIVDTVTMLISQLTSALLPAMAHLYGEGNLWRFRELLMRIAPVLFALALTGLATAAAINREFISLWVGQEFFGGSGTTLFFATAAYVSFVGFIGYDVLMAAGRFQFIAGTFAIFSLVQIPLTVLMLRQFGMVGAPLAATISATGWSMIMWRQLPRVLAPEAVNYRRMAVPVGLSIFVVVAVVSIAAQLLPNATSWPRLTASSIVTATIMLAAILMVSRSIREVAWEEGIATLRSLGWKS